MTATLPQIRAAFERFKAAYPKRPENGWAPAGIAFEKLAKAGVDLESMIRAAAAYAVWTAANVSDLKFIPMAKRWLAERRFEDFLEEAPASASEPSPESPPAHAFEWLKGQIPDSAWRSWFASLVVERGSPTVITAPTQFALNHIKGEWGHMLRRHYGDVVWAVRKKV